MILFKITMVPIGTPRDKMDLILGKSFIVTLYNST